MNHLVQVVHLPILAPSLRWPMRHGNFRNWGRKGHHISYLLNLSTWDCKDRKPRPRDFYTKLWIFCKLTCEVRRWGPLFWGLTHGDGVITYGWAYKCWPRKREIFYKIPIKVPFFFSCHIGWNYVILVQLTRVGYIMEYRYRWIIKRPPGYENLIYFRTFCENRFWF